MALALSGAAVVTVARADDKGAQADKKEGFGKMSVDEVEQTIAKGDAQVFDNNSKKRFEEGHVPTAKWVKPEKMAASDLPEDKAKRLVFYCSNET
jgi:hypothetical protein